MIEKKVSNMIILTAVILLFSFLFASCGDDSNPVKPPLVTVPTGLSSVGGEYIKAVMSGVNDIEFVVADSAQEPVANSWVHFSALVGDGSFVSDSVQTDSLGKAIGQYRFDGTLGHAEVRALVKGVDTVTVSVRASTLIPGATGQGQYILLADTYADVKNFNGTPASLDIFASAHLIVVNYEAAKGVVFVMSDIDSNSILSDIEPVIGIIVNTVYTGKTKDSLGIGSTLAEVFAVHTDSTVTFDNTPPPAYAYRYRTEGITYWTDTSNIVTGREVFEISLTEFLVVPTSTHIDNISGDEAVGVGFINKRYSK